MKRLKHLTERAIKHVLKQKLSAAWNAWVVFAQEKARLNTVFNRAFRWWLRRGIAVAFGTWRRGASESRRIFKICRYIARQWRSKRIAMGMRQWIYFLLEEQRMRRVSEDVYGPGSPNALNIRKELILAKTDSGLMKLMNLWTGASSGHGDWYRSCFYIWCLEVSESSPNPNRNPNPNPLYMVSGGV